MRRFIALQENTLLVVGPRRNPPLPHPASSTSTSISIVTAFGFRMLECGEYVRAVQRLRPDIAVGMGDVLYGNMPGSKRKERMSDRTQSWLNALITGMQDASEGTPNTSLFAPILPLEPEKQTWYLAALQEEFLCHVSGLVLYEIESSVVVPKSIWHLPRLWLGEVRSPHHLLELVEAGLDILTIPFLNEFSDAGVALTFSLVGGKESPKEPTRPLGLDMWTSDSATDLAPFSKNCSCYTCTNHHKAFIRHLLGAKEMLSWVLLQLHNYEIMSQFFAAIRQSVAAGTFQEDRAAFHQNYERWLPAKSGQGPR